MFNFFPQNYRTNERIAFVLMVAVIYGVAAKLSVDFATLPGKVTALWLPCGLTTGLVARFGLWTLPGIVLGSLVGLLPDLLTMDPPLTVIGILFLSVAFACANCLSPGISVAIFKRFAPQSLTFDRIRNVLGFVLGVLAGPAVSATIGITALSIAGSSPWSIYWISWLTWWLSSVVADLLFTPPFLLWRQRSFIRGTAEARQFRHRFYWGEAGLVVILSLGLCWVAFAQEYPVEYSLLPVLIWSAFRLGSFFTSILVSGISLIAIVATAHGAGSFVTASKAESLLLLQSFVSVYSITTLILAAVLQERHEAKLALERTLASLEERVGARTAELNESKAILDSFFSTAPIGIGILDQQLRYVQVNQPLAEIHGTSIAQHLQKTIRDIIPDVALQLEPVYRQVLTTGQPILNREESGIVLTRQPIERTWLTSYFPILDARQVPSKVGVIVMDITDRKEAEEALRRNEERFQQLADASPAAIYTIEQYLSGPVRFEFLSPAFEEIHEIPVADVLDNPAMMFNYFHPDDREGYCLAMETAAATMQPFRHTWRILTPCGKIKWIQGSSRPERRADGVLVWHGVMQDITELKQAEEALRQSETALRRAQQVAHVGSWQVKVQTGKVTWTEESFHIMGWNVTQLEPSLSQFYELIHPDDRNLLRQQIEAVVASQIPYKVEFRVIHSDGSLRYVEARGEAVVNDEGHTTHVIGTNLDVTERKQAEEALRNSEATKNQILKAIPDLILWMNKDGICIDLIEGSSVTNLYTKSEAVGKNLYEILPFDLAQIRVNAIQQALETGEVQIYEQQVTLQSEIRHEEVRVIAVGDNRILIIVRDITARKRAEAALLDSETRFRRAFWDAPIGMALIGLDNRWIKVNPMLCDMLGSLESELLSRTASSLVHPEDWHKLQDCVQQVLSNENRSAQVELRYCCQQGQIIWGLMSLSLVRDGQGKPLYYVAQIQDITERRAIDRMKNEFISIVSHELRTPLTAICGFLGLLDTGMYDKKPEKAKHMIGQALANSNRLVRLVNDILDLERLSSGNIQLIKDACSAEELMQRAATGVQSLADQAKIQLIIVPTTAQAWADPDCIIQTLTNLLSNAIKFSRTHSAITLSAQTRADSVLFSVQDQGRGIPTDKLETIFGRFQQVDVSDSRQKGGTGLGLAICQSIVQQHGGSIWAESILGYGSTFYFTLPLMPEGEQEER